MNTVLLVEDDLSNVKIFSTYLTRMGGLTVRHTEDVEEILRTAQAGEADIILMDVSLSRSLYRGKPMDGIKITQMLKQDPQTADLPVILLTAHAMYGDRENLLKQSGANGYVSKPVIDYRAFVDQVLATMATS